MPKNVLKIDRNSPGNEKGHYSGIYQPIDFIELWGLGFAEGSIVKYLCRHRKKGGREDVAKAKWYLGVLEARMRAGHWTPSLPEGSLDVMAFLESQDLEIQERNAIFNLIEFLRGGSNGDIAPLQIVKKEIDKILEWYDWSKIDRQIDSNFAGKGGDLIEPERFDPPKFLLEDRIYYRKPSPRSCPPPRWFSLDAERPSRTVKFKLGDTEGYFTVSCFSDGTPGEVFIDVGKEGSTVAGLADCWAIAVSMLLRYGVEPAHIYEKFSYQDFDPAGFSGNQVVPMAKSIVDLVVRWMKASLPPTAEPGKVFDDYSHAIETASE